MAKGSKKLPPEYANYLAALLRQIIKTQYDDNATEFSRRAGVSQSQMSDVLKGAGGRSVGIAVLIRLRNHLNMSFDEMLNLPPLRRPSQTPPSELLVPMSAIEDAVRRALAAGPPHAEPISLPPPKAKRRRRHRPAN